MNFREKRFEYLQFLFLNAKNDLERVNVTNPVTKWFFKRDFVCNYNTELKVCFLVEGKEIPDPEIFDVYNYNPKWNTRNILLSECVIEIEGKNFDENIKGTWDTCINLIKRKICFSVFYAVGMRTPHIHIYDIFQEVEDWAEKEMVANLFINQVVSLEYRHLVDRNLLGHHTIALEYAKHWRTGQIKKLLFEHRPVDISK